MCVNGERVFFQLFSQVMVSTSSAPTITLVNWQNKVEDISVLGALCVQQLQKCPFCPFPHTPNKHENSLRAEISEGCIFCVILQNHFKF